MGGKNLSAPASNLWHRLLAGEWLHDNFQVCWQEDEIWRKLHLCNAETGVHVSAQLEVWGQMEENKEGKSAVEEKCVEDK